jgi:hypothetical protein
LGYEIFKTKHSIYPIFPRTWTFTNSWASMLILRTVNREASSDRWRGRRGGGTTTCTINISSPRPRFSRKMAAELLHNEITPSYLARVMYVCLLYSALSYAVLVLHIPIKKSYTAAREIHHR